MNNTFRSQFASNGIPFYPLHMRNTEESKELYRGWLIDVMELSDQECDELVEAITW